MRVGNVVVIVVWLGLIVLLPFIVAEEIVGRWPPHSGDLRVLSIWTTYAIVVVCLVMALLRGKWWRS